jgi:hypothetical protein
MAARVCWPFCRAREAGLGLLAAALLEGTVNGFAMKSNDRSILQTSFIPTRSGA